MLVNLLVFVLTLLPVLIPLIVVVVGTVLTTLRYMRCAARTGRVATVVCGVIITLVVMFIGALLNGLLFARILQDRGSIPGFTKQESVEQTDGAVTQESAQSAAP